MKPARTGARIPRTRSNTRATRAKKISLTVDERVLREVEGDAKRAGRTLSAHVTDALARDVRRRRLATLLEEYEAKHGLISDDELAEIRSQWRG
jgi:hypothetical protein